jgi:2-oxoisovalerate dehydrogenase E1 component alpha subunit
MYRAMVLARALDERMWALNRSGKSPFVISGQGHEGAQAAIGVHMRRNHDWLLPYYRSVTSVLLFGMTPREVLLHQLARAIDPSSGGRQMPGHYGHAGENIYTSSSPVGTQALHAAGIALAARSRGTDQVAVVHMGEGASNQGDVSEAMNFAGIHRLPVIFVVENNGYAISVPAALECAVEDVADRAAGFAMPGVVVDGTDVLGCWRAAREAFRRARAGEGPTLLEAKVTRLTGHSSDDQQTRYRPADELEAMRERDPLPRFRAVLRERGVLAEGDETAHAAQVRAIVEAATAEAEAEAMADGPTAQLHVYRDVPPARMDDHAWPGWSRGAS